MSSSRAAGNAERALRLGLVGAGAWGRNYVLALKRLDGARLAAVASRNPETAGLVGPECLVQVDWQRLLDETLDGVIVATPPSTHLPIAERFVESGTAVLIEKPLCFDPAAALRFRDAVTQRGGFAMVNHIHLFSPAFQLLKRLSPSLGRITGIVSAGGRQGPFRLDTPALWDWGPHDVAMALDLMGGEPLSVSGRRTLRRPAEGGGYAENFELELEFGEGVQARITIGNALSPVRRIEVVHERGTLVYDDLAAPKLAVVGADAASVAQVQREIAACGPFRSPLDCVLESFCEAIRAGSSDLQHLDLAVGVVRVLDQVNQTLH